MIPAHIKAVIFDVDGLIIDSEPAWQKTHNEFITKNKLAINEQYKETFRGIGLKELVVQLKEKFKMPESVEDLLHEYREIFYRNFFSSQKVPLLEGVEECVKAFYAKGYVLAIATGGHTNEKMTKMLEDFDLLKYFSVIVSSDEVHRGKPNPDVFLHAAEKLQIKPEKCLVIEDSVNGILAAKAAKMLVYGVNQEEKVFNDIKDTRADAVFHSLLELKPEKI